MTEVEAWQIQLDTLIEVHEFARQPYNGEKDIKGYLTSRKHELRRKIKKASR